MTDKTFQAIQTAMESSASSSATLTKEFHTCTLKAMEDLQKAHTADSQMAMLVCTMFEMMALLQGQSILLLRALILAQLDPVEPNQELEFERLQ